MQVQPWSSMSGETMGCEYKMRDGPNEDGMIGFIPVFETRAQAEAWDIHDRGVTEIVPQMKGEKK
jgi:hypothetical protein